MAEDAGDSSRAAALRDEHDMLDKELHSARGFGGRSRSFPQARDRARWSVTKAIWGAVAAIDRADPAIADELRATITTGTHCSYTPQRHAAVSWTTAID